MSVVEFNKTLDMFRKGFESISNNLIAQLKKVEGEVNKLVANTDIIPNLKESNKDIFQRLQSISGILAELSFRLDVIDTKK